MNLPQTQEAKVEELRGKQEFFALILVIAAMIFALLAIFLSTFGIPTLAAVFGSVAILFSFLGVLAWIIYEVKIRRLPKS